MKLRYVISSVAVSCLVWCTAFNAIASDLSLFHDGYKGIEWGDSFEDVSKKMTLIPRGPVLKKNPTRLYFIKSGIDTGFYSIPANTYLIFTQNLLSSVEITMHKKYTAEIIKLLYENYGEPAAFTDENHAVWQDALVSVLWMKPISDDPVGSDYNSIIIMSNRIFKKLNGKDVHRF